MYREDIEVLEKSLASAVGIARRKKTKELARLYNELGKKIYSKARSDTKVQDKALECFRKAVSLDKTEEKYSRNLQRVLDSTNLVSIEEQKKNVIEPICNNFVA